MTTRRDIKAASLALSSAVFGVILMRVINYCLPISTAEYGGYLLSTALFSLSTQLVFFLVLPFCIYKFYGGRTVKQTLEYSSVGRFKPYFLLALPLGIAVYFLTVFVSSTWTGLLRLTGYTVPSSMPDMPQSFVPWFFVAEIFITAILPAVCEEFCMRGGLLTAMRGQFKKYTVIVLFGIMFGLFHQNIRQVFYTSLFGALAAYLTIETKSLYPAMIMHFTNNFLSVYIGYATEYGFIGGGLFGFFGVLPVWGFAVVFVALAFVAAAIVLLMLYCRDRRELTRRKKLLQMQAAGTAPNVIQRKTSLPVFVEKPTASDHALMVALGVVTVLTTLFSYVWGFLY